MSWTDYKAAIAGIDADQLTEFNQNGEKLYSRFLSASESERVFIFTMAELYKLGTYETEESQVASAWGDHMGDVDSVDLEKSVAFLRETSHSGTKIEWFRNNVEKGLYRDVVRTWESDGLSAAMNQLINLRGEDNDIMGSNPAKVAMSALLIGAPHAFVMDRNVANVCAPYWANTARLPSVSLPECSACWNSYFSNAGNMSDERYDEVWGDVKYENIRDTKLNMYNVEYFREKHLKREHLSTYQSWEPYAEMLRSKVSDLIGESVNFREMTQILFNVGMMGGEKSDAESAKFYTHSAFYQTV